MNMVDPHMPGDKPPEVVEELFSLALACMRTDNPNFRPKVGSPAGAPPDDSTVLARVEAVLQQWSHPQAFSGRLEAFRQEARRASLQQRELACQPQLHSSIPLAKRTYWVERRGVTFRLEEHLRKDGACVVRGFGGVGKSTLLALYGHQRQGQLLVWWLPCENASILMTAFEHLATGVGVDVQAVWQAAGADADSYR